MRNNPFLVALIVFLLGCGKKEVGYPELQKYIADPNNGLIKKETVNDVEMTIAYRPTDLLAYQDLRNGGKIDSRKVNSARSNFGKYEYFLLTISKDKKDLEAFFGGMPTEYAGRLNMLYFGMKKYISVRNQDNQKVGLVDCIFSRQYGYTPYSQFLLICEKGNIVAGKGSLFITVKEFGLGSGNVDFEFDMGDLVDTPALKFI